MSWIALRDLNIKERIGDEGWDAAAKFMDEMIEIYTRNFNRTPTHGEVMETVEFVYNSAVDKYDENHPPHP